MLKNKQPVNNKVAQFLRDNGFSGINHQHRDTGNTPLITALQQNNLEMVTLLLEEPEIDIHRADKNNRNLVWWAAKLLKLELLQNLVQKGANFNLTDKNPKPTFAGSAQRWLSNVIFKITGFSTHTESEYGQSPLHVLLNHDHLSTEKLIPFLETFKNANADLNIRDKNKETPLMIAAQQRNLPAIQWLLQNGADPCITNRDNNTFLEFVDVRDKEQVLTILTDLNMNQNWYHDVDQVKEFGHIMGVGSFLKLGDTLGLGGIVSVPLRNNEDGTGTVKIYTESWDPDKAYQALLNELNNYQARNPNYDKNLDPITQALALTNAKIKEQKGLSYVKESVVNDLLRSYKNGQPIIIPISVPGHCMGLAISNGQLIYTDRFYPSGGKISKCTKVFNLQDPSDETLKELIKDIWGANESGEDIIEKLNHVVDFDRPNHELGDKAQSHGTCSFSNPRSNIEGILYAMKNDPKADPIHIQAQAKRSYRDFVYSSRFHKAKELVNMMNDAEKSGNVAKANMFYELAAGYIKGHTNQTKNDGSDWKNTLLIFQGFPPRQKSQFTTDNPLLARQLGLRSQPIVEEPLPDLLQPIDHAKQAELVLGKNRTLSLVTEKVLEAPGGDLHKFHEYCKHHNDDPNFQVELLTTRSKIKDKNSSHFNAEYAYVLKMKSQDNAECPLQIYVTKLDNGLKFSMSEVPENVDPKMVDKVLQTLCRIAKGSATTNEFTVAPQFSKAKEQLVEPAQRGKFVIGSNRGNS